MSKITLENTATRGKVTVHDGGSVFLCFLNADLTVSEVEGMPADTAFQVRLPNLRVRINVAGQPSIGFPEREWTDSDGKTRTARVFSAVGDETYEQLIRLVFALPDIDRRVSKALAMQDEVAKAKAA